MLLLQRVPHYTEGIPPTTCRHLQCPYEDAIFQGGDFILSLEKPERCDPSRNSLSYKAITSLSRVLKSRLDHIKGKRGLGEHGRGTMACHLFRISVPRSSKARIAD